LKDDFLWVEKYRPQKIADIAGNEEAKTAFVDWLTSKRRRKKAVLLYGPPGVGKTAIVNAASNELGFTIIEMNASDTRTEKAINKIAGPATSFVALDKFSSTSKGNLLFLDEVDGVFGNQDRGGIGAIIKIIEDSRVPVILAANNTEIQNLRPLKKVCELIRFQPVRVPLIIAMLQKITKKENIDSEFDALEKIAQNSRGDVRSAINDLQGAAGKNRTITLQDLMNLTPRNKETGLYETLIGVFSAKSLAQASTRLNNSSIEHDDLLLSISDNLPLRYLNPEELGVAYDFVSKADVIRGRIGTENWHLLRYFYNYLSEAATVNPISFKSFEVISPPIRIITLFWTKSKRIMLDSICSKISEKCHVSRRVAKQDFVPFIKSMLEKQRSTPVVTWLRLAPEEIDYLVKMTLF
jgi:replication factor C large subunit